MSLTFKQRLAVIEQQPQSIIGLGRGIEREALRVDENAHLSQKSHPYAFGSALCHSSITTDYAESLLEFITPVAKTVPQLFDYLNDIHHYVAKNLDVNETLWPISMPCYVNDQSAVELAQYGSSNVGRMKTTYRQGLSNRYGSMMQIISGVHYNFSLPNDFWPVWAEIHDSPLSGKERQSAGYLGLMRNYFRYGWVIPFLFGASPAICRSFIQGKETLFDFQEFDEECIYLPYATSLRLSDLGYTSSEQAALNIAYNSLPEYITSVRDALQHKSPEFKKLGIKNAGNYVQLNDNVLQIENELYASIRPKRVLNEGETPSQALHARGVEYIEIRSLDVNPFEKVGISEEQVYFLDLFLIWCAMRPSDSLTKAEEQHYAKNFDCVVTQGRKPDLQLEIEGSTKTIAAWGEMLSEELQQLAVVLDKNSPDNQYSDAIKHISVRFDKTELTSSARVLSHLTGQNRSKCSLALELSKEYKKQLIAQDYRCYSDAYFEQQKTLSLQKQAQKEQADVLNFDDYLEQYFIKAQNK
ncbi:glutamate--cysteine ligase [Psychromonas sp. CNPT3]|uniref:glutamate--cysteine ligase n=1 Tax=Psychromonas sp. CNPT3 TaxID=314282 RepID=UPI00006E98F8|nr:glutamate--cysteine ligase [Psychromonas sp. CNPT3]AGH82294.1 glutamate--cysteine ligase [Psychromonas sp. CNPT3]